jgi:SOS response regulatory protein OraA/RecX
LITEGRDLRVSALTFFIMKIKTRNDVIRYLKENDSSYRIENNVIFAPKAFLINTVIQWCYNQLEKKKMQPSEMEFYLTSIGGFLQDNNDLYWDEDDNLVIS